MNQQQNVVQQSVVPESRKIDIFNAVSSLGVGMKYSLRLHLLTVCDQGLLVIKNTRPGIPWKLPSVVQTAGNPSFLDIALKALPRAIIDMGEVNNPTPRQGLYAFDEEDGRKTAFALIGVPSQAVLCPSHVVHQWVRSLQDLNGLLPDNWESPEVVSLRKAVDVAIKSKLLPWGETVH